MSEDEQLAAVHALELSAAVTEIAGVYNDATVKRTLDTARYTRAFRACMDGADSTRQEDACEGFDQLVQM